MTDPKAVVNQVVTLWNEHFQSSVHHEGIQNFVAQSGLFDQMKQSNLLTVVFSFADLSILHINKAAADYFGGTVEEITQSGAAYIISCFDHEQLNFATYAAGVSVKETLKKPVSELVDSYTCYGNWIIKSKTGKKRRALFRIFPLQMNEKGLPLIGMYLIHDVMPFLREDVWWYRTTAGDNHFSHYHSEDKKLVKKDLLSDREKMVLQYLSDGFSSKDIGAQLHLSSHTVDNHRRRMLAKTGAIDTSALIHIAKLSGIL